MFRSSKMSYYFISTCILSPPPPPQHTHIRQGRERYCFSPCVCLSQIAINHVNATPIVLAGSLKLCRWFCQCLRIFTTFGCNSQINFWLFFRSWNLVILGLQHIYNGYLVCIQFCERNSCYNFTQVFLKLCRCFLFF